MTWFDLIVIGLMGLSILFATFRGISRELTTLIALGIGAGAALWLSGPLAGVLGVSSSLMNNLFLITILFAAFFLLSLFALNLTIKRLISEKPGRIDRTIGAIFGFLRGWLLVGLGYLALDYYFEADSRPEGITNAATLGFAKSAADILENMGLETVSAASANQAQQAPQTQQNPHTQQTQRDGSDFAITLPTD